MRLAHAKGLITQKEVNWFQDWALIYWLYLDRRTSNETMRNELEMQTFSLAPDRWAGIYQGRADSIMSDPEATSAGDGGDIPVDDLDLINQWYEGKEQQRAMNGGMGFTSHADEWGGWQ